MSQNPSKMISLIFCLWALLLYPIAQAKTNETEKEKEKEKENEIVLSPFELALNGSAFVDHTYMVKDCFNNIPVHGRFIMPVAPYGFGKTTNLDMLKLFFGIDVDPKTGHKVKNKKKTKAYKIFTNPKLNISHEKEFIEKHLGEYPIIELDFENVIADTYPEMEQQVYERVLDAYLRYEWLYKKLSKEYADSNDTVKKIQLDDFKRFINGSDITLKDLMYSLRNLAHILNDHFNHRVMVLIDNADDPLMFAVETNETLRPIHYLMDYMLAALTKVAPRYVDYMVVTGISAMAFAPRSLYTNNLYMLHFLGKHFAHRYYGFTADEATALFDKFKLPEEEREKIRDNCNGYFTAYKKLKIWVYNPFPVVKYLQTPKPKNQIMLENYWVRTGLPGRHMEKFLRINDLRATLLSLLWHKEGRIIFDPDVWITDIERFQQVVNGEYEIYGYVKLFFSYLQENGYLTYREGRFIHGLPNKEVIGDLRMQLKMFYFEDYNMRFGATTMWLESIVVEVNTTQPYLNHLEKELNKLFEPLSRSINIGFRFETPELELEAILYCTTYPQFTYANGGIPLKTQQGKRLNATADLGILSYDEEIMLLIEVTYQQSVDAALNRIKDLVPADHNDVRVVKYLGINVDQFYRAKVGVLPNVEIPVQS